MMQKDNYDKIISFLQGASWAIVLLGALMTFKFFILFGTYLAIFLTLLYIVFSLFFILALDAFSVNKKRLEESKKQTELLEKIYSKETNF
ncbi:hypothetical protein [Sulfurimonas sp.]|jgi:cobalamin biosynthesis protein CobD/CbiB|uniref:hypothetical protein n=1 Tax=Sulfurimonas sp. TaxID=2022749 RepID=UPI0025F0EACF|nr:hypothetical protein [Sulfurimonas sp.]